jgi:type II secretory pathway pseudopilin PulG
VLSLSPLSSRLANAGNSLRDARGFTLVETLVAIVTGIVVTGALFAILEVSLHQTARAGDVVQASQLGRSTMTRIVDELRSACLAPEFTPVQASSTPSQLVFRNTYSEAAVPTSATEHEIVWNEKAGKGTLPTEKANALVDFVSPSNGGSWPEFTYPETPSRGIVVGENITQAEGPKKELLPLFQYYRYATTAGAVESGVPVGTLTAIKLEAGKELGAVVAPEVAAVLISFRAGAVSSVYKTHGSVADFSNQVTFAFSAPNPEAKIEDGPCQ